MTLDSLELEELFGVEESVGFDAIQQVTREKKKKKKKRSYVNSHIF